MKKQKDNPLRIGRIVMEKAKKAKTAEFDVKEIYTPLSVAKKEIWKRWNDKALRKKMEDFLGGDVPKVFKKEPICL